MSMLKAILDGLIGAHASETVRTQIDVEAALATDPKATRAVLAQALSMVLFHDLLMRVPSGRAYVEGHTARGGKVVFDHGALRTVAWPHNGTLPAGRAAIARVLEPLGYTQSNIYPLERLKMTGYSYTHRDFPEAIAQYFVSEFHPERFDTAFQDTVTRVVATSRDPLRTSTLALLQRVAVGEVLPLEDAVALVGDAARCFARHHDEPTLADYEALKAQSSEMAWIATEGNAFNHATDRVPDVFATADAERAAGRAIKEKVEVSGCGRVRQTALIADKVTRGFRNGDAKSTGARIEMQVPGSFYEFISRDCLPQSSALDLAFDAGNATGIFKVTVAN
jgi:hypothetical protein